MIWDYAIKWKKTKLKSNENSMFSYTMLSWKMPPHNFFKLNVDGTRTSPSGKIGAVGVIRNHFGDWIIGFHINIGVGEILDAEAWGLFHGLKLAVDLNIKNLLIESDSAILVQLMQNSNFDIHPLGSLLCGCKNIMNKMEDAQLLIF
ncbi:PREDICTED: putative ribonuclease H protein At1g65750-like [Fragaria vesca subsp. vesca]